MRGGRKEEWRGTKRSVEEVKSREEGKERKDRIFYTPFLLEVTFFRRGERS